MTQLSTFALLALCTFARAAHADGTDTAEVIARARAATVPLRALAREQTAQLASASSSDVLAKELSAVLAAKASAGDLAEMAAHASCLVLFQKSFVRDCWYDVMPTRYDLLPPRTFLGPDDFDGTPFAVVDLIDGEALVYRASFPAHATKLSELGASRVSPDQLKAALEAALLIANEKTVRP